MDRHRATSSLRCALALCVLGMTPVRAQEPTPVPTTAVSPAASVAPAATATPTATASPANETPTPTPKILYPSTSMSSLFGSSGSGGSTGAGGLATTFLVLLGLCAAGFYLMRRSPAFAANFKGAPRKLVVNETRSLGNRQFLVVVEYENERMLLGVTPGKIDYLCPLRGPHGEPGAFPPIKEGGA